RHVHVPARHHRRRAHAASPDLGRHHPHLRGAEHHAGKPHPLGAGGRGGGAHRPGDHAGHAGPAPAGRHSRARGTLTGSIRPSRGRPSGGPVAMQAWLERPAGGIRLRGVSAAARSEAMAVPTVTLNNGVTMPQLGFGTWQVGYDAVAAALAAGYRCFDTAEMYRNETAVAAALADSGLDRSDVFITTNLWNNRHGFQPSLDAFHASRRRLGLDVIDLYLIHWPNA